MELSKFLNREKIDVMLLSETHLTNKYNFTIPGFLFYKTNHPDGKAHGGTGVLVRRRLKHHFIGSYEQNNLQATSICVQTCKKDLTLSAVYCPPRFILSEAEFLNFFKTLGDKFIAAGDYNAKHKFWGSRTSNPKGKQLYKVIINKQNNLDIESPGKPTYWPADPKKIPDLIDFAVTKNIRRDFISVDAINELSSDHSPVLFRLFHEPKTIEIPQSLTTTQTNWLRYKKYISTHIHTNYEIESIGDINDAVTILTNMLITAAVNSTPLKEGGNEVREYISNQEIEALVMDKRRLQREWQRNRSPAAKSRLKEAIKKLNAALNKEKNDLRFQFISNLSPNGSKKLSLWKASKSLKTPTVLENPLRDNNGEWARSDEQKAMVFARHLSLVFQPNEASINSSLPIQTINSHSTDSVVTPSDVSSVIKYKLACKKSPGHDRITPIMLKNLPSSAVQFISNLFNAIINIGFYPSAWKKSIIIMIPKSGKNPTLASSYRPISLLPCLSKLFEKVILLKLTPYLEEYRLIPHHQFGFRDKHGTIEQVNRITNEIRTAFERREYCSCIFLDVAQAFDKVWHEGLLFKIKCFLPSNLHAVLESYMSNRVFRVKYKSFTTIDFPILAGVPQGSVLGPFLYVLYTSDIPTGNRVITSTFADDTAILSRNKDILVAVSQLEQQLRHIEDWLAQWRIKVNEEKCRHVTFTLNRSPSPSISLHGVQVPQANDASYLGINLDKRLTWRKHIEAKKKLK